MRLSKLASRPILRLTSIRPLYYFQIRRFQSPKGDPGSQLNIQVGIYKDPRFMLDLKPYEWRDGQWKTWTPLPALIVWSLAVYVVVTGIIALVAYSLTDHLIAIDRSNMAPFLRIRNGRDWRQTKNAAFRFPGSIGGGFDQMFSLRSIFYHEIEDAIQRRQEQDRISNL